MMSLHIWAMSHGVASLFARGDAGRRALPMAPEELLEAGVLVYLRGLGLIAEPQRPENNLPGARLTPRRRRAYVNVINIHMRKP